MMVLTGQTDIFYTALGNVVDIETTANWIGIDLLDCIIWTTHDTTRRILASGTQL